MKKQNQLGVLCTIAAVLLLAGCATTPAPAVAPVFQSHLFPDGAYEAKVDGFEVILDASSSMGEPYGDQTKYAMAMDFLHTMNQTLPNLDIQAALRTFGPDQSFSLPAGPLDYGVVDYRGEDFKAALEAAPQPDGASPLHSALDAAAGDLTAMDGSIAVIVFSDGKKMTAKPLASAQALKAKFGDRLCIYTVLLGNDEAGAALLQQIADAGGCGFATRADSFASARDMGDFVEKIFLAGKKPVDSDGDGVYDDQDQCPGTPRGAAVDDRGCPLDTDGDGVYDYMDKCPGTPMGERVNASGCPPDTDSDGVTDDNDQCPGTPQGAHVNEIGCWVLTGVNFDTGSAKIKPESYPILNGVVTIFSQNPSLEVEIQGHTDNVGSAASNRKLSDRRAKSVRQFFIEKGIDGGRLFARGYGFDKPVADNDTAEGRAKNRRVELKPIY